MTPEFSRREAIDTIGVEPRTIDIAASEAERTALARRFDLRAVGRLDAGFVVRRDPAGLVATGWVRATVTQACAATGDPVTSEIDETVMLRFVASVTTGEEVELSDEAVNTIEIEGDSIDLGEAAAETMVLALDPFPRAAGAAAALAAAGVTSSEEAGPFGALTGLRDRLGDG